LIRGSSTWTHLFSPYQKMHELYMIKAMVIILGYLP
jgi:hypothetical protein